MILDGDPWRSSMMFLDEKPQRIDIHGKPHVFNFVDNFRTVLINGHPFNFKFGGDAMAFYVNGRKVHFRLTALPPGIRAGQPLKTHEEVFNPVAQPEAMEGVEDESSQGAASVGLDRFINNVAESPTTEKLPSKFFKNEAAVEEPPQPQTTSQKPAPIDFDKLFSNLKKAKLIGIPGLDSSQPEAEVKKEAEAEQVPEKAEVEATVKPEKKINFDLFSTIKPIQPVVLVNGHSSLST